MVLSPPQKPGEDNRNRYAILAVRNALGTKLVDMLSVLEWHECGDKIIKACRALISTRKRREAQARKQVLAANLASALPDPSTDGSGEKTVPNIEDEDEGHRSVDVALGATAAVRASQTRSARV